MRFRSFAAVLLAASALAPGGAFAEPGYLWEMKMEMPGMPFPMPAQKTCVPKTSNEPPVSKDDGECTMLDKKVSGNRFQWKARCKDGNTVTGDITSSPTAYSGSMTMTEKSGETMKMTMTGKRIGDCDYKDRSGEIKAMQKKSEDDVARMCRDAVDRMQSGLFATNQEMCAGERPAYCKRLNSLEGFEVATKNIPLKEIDNPMVGLVEGAKACRTTTAQLVRAHCASAVRDDNFAFVTRMCPADKPKLCGKAVAAGKLNFVAANCPAEKAALVKKHCEGRKYTSQIEAKYQAFCASAAAGTADDDGSAAEDKPKESAAGDAPAAPSSVEEGVKLLKGLFGR